MNSEDVALAVGSNFFIVMYIVRHMHWKDVAIAQKVSPLWLEVVNSLKITELHPKAFYYRYICDRDTITGIDVPEVGGKDCFLVPNLLITIQPLSSMVRTKRLDNKKYRCPIGFCSEASSSCRFCRLRRTKHRFCDYTCLICSPSTRVITIRSNYVFFNQYHLNVNHIDNYMCGFAIPKIPGVNVHHVRLRYKFFSIDNIFCKSVLNIMVNEVIKCILVFVQFKEAYYLDTGYTEKLLNYIQRIQLMNDPPVRFAVCGSYVQEFFSSNPRRTAEEMATNRDIKLVIFSVNKNHIADVEFDAYSTVYDEDTSPASSLIDHKDMMLRKCPLRKFQLCLSVSDDFQSYYHGNLTIPGMPMIGWSSHIQFGAECLPDTQAIYNYSHEPPFENREWFSHWCSVAMTFLTWGPLIRNTS